MRRRGQTWQIGGIGLIVCGALGTVQLALRGGPLAVVIDLLTGVFYAASLALFAVGLNRADSVVARRPLGLFAVIVVGLVAAVWSVTHLLPGATVRTAVGWQAFEYVIFFLSAALALVAVVSIARAGIVPDPWRWAPAVVLGVQSMAWVIPQLALSANGSLDAQTVGGLSSALGAVAFMSGTFGLGVVAVVLAARRRGRSVIVYES